MGEVLLKGIDVSKHQGIIDWSKVETDFAIIRAGWSWYQGGMNIDDRFIANVSGATKNLIPFGVYLYAYDLTPEAAVISANKLADTLEEYAGAFDFPVVYDFEDNQYITKPKTENTKICEAFLRTLKSRGFYPMLYTYTSFANAYLVMEALKEYDFWVADYRITLGYTGKYSMWQYSSQERVSGVPAVVDMNYCYVDYPKLIQSMGLNGRKPTKPTETKELENLLKELEDLIGRYR